jgi:hypothetical protein
MPITFLTQNSTETQRVVISPMKRRPSNSPEGAVSVMWLYLIANRSTMNAVVFRAFTLVPIFKSYDVERSVPPPHRVNQDGR